MAHGWRTLRLSGVASLEKTTQPNESFSGRLNSVADEEGHDHSNRWLYDELIFALAQTRLVLSPGPAKAGEVAWNLDPDEAQHCPELSP
jgi:hypothetical protein